VSRTLDGTVIHVARSRLVVHQTEQIRICLRALDDEQIWWRPNDDANSIGNLVLHLVGSTRHYIGHIIGGSDYRRDRDAEFAERRQLSRDELLRRLDAAVAEADRALAALPPERLRETTAATGKPTTYAQILMQQLLHFATHAGQIVYATKLLKPGALDDIWRKTPAG